MNEIRKYAASFILDMRGVTETVEAVIERLSSIISDLGGKISEIKNLGQKDFERVANKKLSNGIYIKMQLEGAPPLPSGIKTKLKLDKTINRILIEAAE